jgi:glycosyltransferase involved in cell wall biosynthesis
MKNILFHSNQLGIRGCEVAMYDYAHYNEKLLNNKSYIISKKNSDMGALKKFQNRFDVFLYNDFDEIEDIIKRYNINYTYFIKAGDVDGKLTKSSINLVHSVFQHYNPHGDKYVYVSKWLSQIMAKNENDYIPHIVDLPKVNQNLRIKLNIPEEAIVFGRHGGYDEFNLNYTQKAIKDSLKENDNIYFVFMNTKPFITHERVKYINPTYDFQNKSNFIGMCDAMIHARQIGESFGLSIAEFLFHDKPVISSREGVDKHHHYMLSDKGLWYSSYEECKNLILKFKKNEYEPNYFKILVEDFTPQNVMKRFENIFLK